MSTAKSQHWKRCIEAASKEDGNGNRSVYCNFGLCMKCVDSSRKHPDLVFRATNTIPQLPTPDLEPEESLLDLQPYTRERRRKRLQSKRAATGFDDIEKRPKAQYLRPRHGIFSILFYHWCSCKQRTIRVRHFARRWLPCTHAAVRTRSITTCSIASLIPESMDGDTDQHLFTGRCSGDSLYMHAIRL